MLKLQATNILNEAYYSRICEQLAHLEAKKTELSGKGRLMGDGLPCLLSGDVFFEQVVDSDVAHRQEIERLCIREERAVLLVEWKKQEARKAEIVIKRAE